MRLLIEELLLGLLGASDICLIWLFGEVGITVARGEHDCLQLCV